MSVDNRISALINSQVPFFVRNDHSQFVKFLEKYYEYLEQDQKVVNRIKSVLEVQNIDLTQDEFAEHLYDTFMKYIPHDIKTDKRLLIKHIKDFYRSKGTEASIRFLMNALYHAQTSFYYPKLDVLKASDGKWFVQRSLRITDTHVNNVPNNQIRALEYFVGTLIRGSKSNTTAIVERVERIFEQGAQIDEVILSNINGEFENGETISAQFNDVEYTSTISANIFSGLINTITIEESGSNYQVGDPVLIQSSTGSGAIATVGAVTTGNIVSIGVLAGGAGFQENNNILIVSSDSGFGAQAYIGDILDNEFYHPNTYNIMSSMISLEANTPINNSIYSNLNSSNASTSIEAACDYWVYANTGPIGSVFVTVAGQNYQNPPLISVSSNTIVRSLGILGRMEIRNGGENYQIGDTIEFVNLPGCMGTGAYANVTNVDMAASNAISEVAFQRLPGHILGGSGYTMDALPGARVISNTGNGANVVVTATLADGAHLRADQTSIGAITRIMIVARGSGYDQNTVIDLTQVGDGRAKASVSVLEGIITYPGRWINDDGKLSSYKFLQDRDYYQNYSYVVRSKEPIAKYRSVLKNLTHPAGTKLFGEFLYDKEAANTSCPILVPKQDFQIWLDRNYVKTANVINVAYGPHTANVGNAFVGIEFLSGDMQNVSNGIYLIEDAGPNYLILISDDHGNSNGVASVSILPEWEYPEEEEEEDEE